MTVKKAVVTPEYLSFYIAGKMDIRVPLDHERRGIVASGECINVGCLYWNEGDTTITLGPFEELNPQAGPPYSRFTMPDDFAAIRDKVFPMDKRTLADMRRSGAIELQAGGTAPTTKMANSISSANAIHKTYQPVDLNTVRQADAARKIGRQRIRDANK